MAIMNGKSEGITRMKVAVFGASGLVGAAFVEKMIQEHHEIEVVPIIHSSGSAWRLSPYNLDLQSADLLNPALIRKALQGVTHVVNCTRGSEDLMDKGLQNLLKVCRQENVRRFVHLSSVAVYGDPPPDASSTEAAVTNPEKGSYGWIKLKQDELVQKAHAAGLSSVILCPPNITGPYSYFSLGVLQSMRDGQFALLGNGGAPINLVDIGNLVHAIHLALTVEKTDGERFFITDDEDLTWNDFTQSLKDGTNIKSDLPQIDREEFVRQLVPSSPDKGSVWKSLKHVLSDDVRGALQQDPLFDKFLMTVRKGVAQFPSIEDKLRLNLGGMIQVPKVRTGPSFNVRLISQQLRTVRHLCEAAKVKLGYVPILSFVESTQNFCSWYEQMHGTNKGDLQLLKEL